MISGYAVRIMKESGGFFGPSDVTSDFGEGDPKEKIMAYGVGDKIKSVDTLTYTIIDVENDEDAGVRVFWIEAPRPGAEFFYAEIRGMDTFFLAPKKTKFGKDWHLIAFKNADQRARFVKTNNDLANQQAKIAELDDRSDEEILDSVEKMNKKK